MRRAEEGRKMVWKSLRPPGSEYCNLLKKGRDWLATGTVVRSFREGVATVLYAIRLSRGWETKEVRVEQVVRGVHSGVTIAVRDWRWRVDGRLREDLDGCIDVDLGASPLTNTFPIKRTGLKIGDRVEVRAAWVRFPSLDVAAAEQTYERVGKSTYIYRSKSGFRAELLVDGFGLVARYGDYWLAA